MKIRRGGVVLAGYKLVEGGLLFRAAAQNQQQIGHCKAGTDRTPVVLDRRGRMCVALENGQLAFVDLLDDLCSRS